MIVLPRDDLQTEELVLEEVEVFKVSLAALVTLLLILFLPYSTFIYHVCYLRYRITNPAFTCFLIMSLQVPTPITTMKISSKRVS